jgi:hypothetical protein
MFLFCTTQRFAVAFARALRLSQARGNQSPPFRSTRLRQILISSHLHLGLPMYRLPSCFPPELHMDFSSMRVTCQAHLILHDVLVYFTVYYMFGEVHKLWSHYAVFSSFLLVPPSYTSIDSHEESYQYSNIIGKWDGILNFELFPVMWPSRH